jgi:hypothetical protein
VGHLIPGRFTRYDCPGPPTAQLACTSAEKFCATGEYIDAAKRYDARRVASHDERLRALADALRVPPSRVVSRLRTRNVMYFGPGGTLLLATSADWSDERIVEAAFQLFVVEDTPRLSRGREWASA